MKLLLDTHLLLRAAGWRGRRASGLSAKALALIDDPANSLIFSAASIWEVAIKSGLGRDDFKADARLLRRGLVDNGYVELPITSEHALAAGALPNRHKDPFDRMLIAQATCEGIILATSDRIVAAYPGPIRKV